MRIALYARSADTVGELAQLRAYCRQQESGQIVGEYADEPGQTTALDQLLAAADRSEFDVVIVPKVAALPHRTIEEVCACILQLRNAGVEFRSLTEPLFRADSSDIGRHFEAIVEMVCNTD